jgi:SEC-C motif-containing protein
VVRGGSDRVGRDDAAMAKIGRNELCACGSGLKVKRCCGIARGPSQESLAQAFLRSAAREVAVSAAAFSEREFARLLADLVDLPCLDLSLQAELPKLLSSALGQLCEAIADDDELAGDAVIEEALDELDTPVERARLARAVIAARDSGRCGRRLAAVALIDLASGSRQLLCASVIQAVAVHAGVARTPAGVLLAA